jgi:hypothetical protein
LNINKLLLIFIIKKVNPNKLNSNKLIKLGI